jgi:hypothetical protein
MTLLIKSTPTRGQPLVKDTVKPHLNPGVSECLMELLLCSPNFTKTPQNLPILKEWYGEPEKGE